MFMFEDEEPPLGEELDGQPVGQEERCRAPLPETPSAESAAKECQRVRYHRPKGREDSASPRTTAKGG